MLDIQVGTGDLAAVQQAQMYGRHRFRYRLAVDICRIQFTSSYVLEVGNARREVRGC